MVNLRDTVEQTVNMIIPRDTQPSNQAQSHSSQNSISSTTSNLLKQNQENNSFDNLEANAQKERNRLSDMLDSYKNSSEITHSTNDTESFTDADDFIVNRRSLDGQTREFIEPVKKTPSISEDDHFEFDATQAATPKPRPLELLPNMSKGQSPVPSPSSLRSNRKSFVSDYAPSIHEVNKIAYVVDGQDESQTDEDATVEVTSKPSVQRKASVIKISRSSSKGSNKKAVTSSSSQYNHTKNKESAASYISNSNSGSGSSKYPESTYSREIQLEDQPMKRQVTPQEISNNPYISTTPRNIPEESESTSSFEFNLGPLKTTKGHQGQLTVERSHVTQVDPSIPSRSRRRPVSSAFINSPVNKLKQESQTNRPKSVDLGEMDNLMTELNREINRSPNPKTSSSESGFHSAHEDHSQQPEPPLAQQQQQHHHHHQLPQSVNHSRTGSNTDSIRSGTSKRPLPPPPVPKHEKKPSVTYEDEVIAAQEEKEPLEHQEVDPLGQTKQRNISTSQNDDDYVTEDEEVVKESETKSIKEIKKKHKKKSTHKKRTSSGFKKGHFNHETLTQLLQVTEGTIIGQEFQNIGLEANEKQLLERLVDSLSRLTADMVIDSERHDESVRRLNKAIKALEGF